MKDSKLSRILTLFLTFLKIGAFTFGGGYAMIPLIQKEVVDNKKWITDQDILDIIAIAESTPGPIAINSATFIGYRVAGFFGSFFATLGVVIPSFIIIILISFVLRQFEALKTVKYAFMGIRAGVLALIAKALVNMYKQCKKGLISYIVIFFAFAVTVFTNINLLYVIIACAVIGLISSLVVARKEKNK